MSKSLYITADSILCGFAVLEVGFWVPLGSSLQGAEIAAC